MCKAQAVISPALRPSYFTTRDVNARKSNLELASNVLPLGRSFASSLHQRDLARLCATDKLKLNRLLSIYTTQSESSAEKRARDRGHGGVNCYPALKRGGC